LPPKFQIWSPVKFIQGLNWCFRVLK
jgi:hypothetical protein